MEEFSFFIPMAKIPTITHQEQKVRVVNGKPIFYDPPALAAARQKFTAHLAKHKPAQRFPGAVRLVTTWCFALCGQHKDGEYKKTKPDTDNLIKLLKDCMTAVGYWNDDAQVASEITEKFWAAKPGIWVAVYDLEADD